MRYFLAVIVVMIFKLQCRRHAGLDVAGGRDANALRFSVCKRTREDSLKVFIRFGIFCLISTAHAFG